MSVCTELCQSCVKVVSDVGGGKFLNSTSQNEKIQYYQNYKNFGISYSTLTKELKEQFESGDIQVRGAGNYSSDEEKEIDRLKRELRDTKDVLDVLKKAIGIPGK